MLVRDVLKKPSKEQEVCHHPKPILLDTGEMKKPYDWAVSYILNFCSVSSSILLTSQIFYMVVTYSKFSLSTKSFIHFPSRHPIMWPAKELHIDLCATIANIVYIRQFHCILHLKMAPMYYVVLFSLMKEGDHTLLFNFNPDACPTHQTKTFPR